MSLNSTGGYPSEWFVTKPSAHFSCGICFDVLKEPQMCRNGHNFCLTCISTALQHSKECPTCKCSLNVESLVGNLAVKNMIDEMVVKCSSCAETTCDWSGTLAESYSHLRTCRNRTVDCPLCLVRLCSDVSCSGRVHHEKVRNHITENQSKTSLADAVCLMSETIALQAEENRLLRALCWNESAKLYAVNNLTTFGTLTLLHPRKEHGICLKKLDNTTDGDYFLGHFKDGVRSGFGVERRGGVLYRGQWKSGEKTGLGFMVNTKSNFYHKIPEFYSGEFLRGKFHGSGRLVSGDMPSYNGEFKNGVPFGQGTLAFNNGDVATGRFEENLMTSSTLTYTDGSVFEGSMASHRIFKKGTFTGADGVVFSGTFTATASNINVSGKGTITYTDGTVYTGEFRNAQRHGKGKYVDAADVVSEGVWTNNAIAIQYSETLIPVSKNRFRPGGKVRRGGRGSGTREGV